jgi:hypothetical protein
LTKKRIRHSFLLVMAMYLLAIGVAVLIRIFDPTEDGDIYATYKDVVPLIIALPAAWLGYCLQRRNSYMQQLRALWTKLVETVQLVNQYTFLDSPTKEHHADACHKLSIAIDEIRCVFMNLGESEKDGNRNQKGLYPFESLKDMHKELVLAGFGSATSVEKLEKLRENTFKQWKAIRDVLLMEFDREEPTHFESRFVQNNRGKS